MSDDPISGYIEAHADGMCNSYIIVATIEHIDGSADFFISTMRNQTASVTLGLLESASAAEKYRIATTWNKP
jgi:hypothetical protein